MYLIIGDILGLLKLLLPPPIFEKTAVSSVFITEQGGFYRMYIVCKRHLAGTAIFLGDYPLFLGDYPLFLGDYPFAAGSDFRVNAAKTGVGNSIFYCKKPKKGKKKGKIIIFHAFNRVIFPLRPAFLDIYQETSYMERFKIKNKAFKFLDIRTSSGIYRYILFVNVSTSINICEYYYKF